MIDKSCKKEKTGNFDNGDSERKSSLRVLLVEIRLLKKTTEVILGKVETRKLREAKG